jgi:4-amino-4-deoxy-L-arabinose transferase-like glycosyltransferase
MIDPDLRMRADSIDRKHRWLLAGIIMLAISLRVWGLDFGLPYVYHPDEPIVGIAQRIFKTGDLNPHFFNYPSLFFYIHSLSYGPYYLSGKLMGAFQSPADIPGPRLNTMGSGFLPAPSTFLLGRMVTTIFGTTVVALVFLSGWRLTDNKRIGLLAALMTAISPANVSNSRFITPDTIAAFFVLLSFWGSTKVFQQGKTGHYVLAGLAAGLAASTKYNGALIALGLIVAHLLRNGNRIFRDRNFYVALVFAAFAFVLTTPFAVLDFPEFWSDLQFETQHYTAGHAGMEGNTLVWYVKYLWQTEGPISLLAILGILWGIHTRPKPIVLLATFPLTYFAFINRFAVRNVRTLLPLIPFLFLLGSSLLIDWYELAKKKKSKLLTAAVCSVIALSLAVPLVETVQQGIRINAVDSRETARIWIAENLPEGARVAVEPYTPYVDPQSYSVQGFNSLIDHSSDWYIRHDFDFLVFAEGAFGRFFSDPDKYSDQVSQYQSLFRAFDMVKLFIDGDYEVRIYQVSD